MKTDLIFASVITIALLLTAVLVMAQEYEASSVKMNATVGHLISITPSAAVNRGILFGQVTAGTDNNMAENDTTSPTYTNCTEYYITADGGNSDSIDFWTKAADLTDGTNTILIGNVTHEANQTANGVNVNMTATTDGSVQLTTTYAKLGGATAAPCDAVPPNGNCYVAFWLDVPSAIPSGTYESDWWFCANATHGTTACS